MQTVEMFFHNTLEGHRLFKEAALLLTREVPTLSPVELQTRCDGLAVRQRELAKNNDQLCLILDGMGPEILDTSHIGELQRAIDNSVLAGEALYTAILLYRSNLEHIVQTADCSEASACYRL